MSKLSTGRLKHRNVYSLRNCLVRLYFPCLLIVRAHAIAEVGVRLSLGSVGMVSHRAWISCRAKRARQMSPRTLFYFWIMSLSVLMGVWQWHWRCPPAISWSATLVQTLKSSPCDLFVYFVLWILMLGCVSWEFVSSRGEISDGVRRTLSSHDALDTHEVTRPYQFFPLWDSLLTKTHSQV